MDEKTLIPKCGECDACDVIYGPARDEGERGDYCRVWLQRMFEKELDAGRKPHPMDVVRTIPYCKVDAEDECRFPEIWDDPEAEIGTATRTRVEGAQDE